MTALSLLGRFLGSKLRQTWYIRDADGTAGEFVSIETALKLSAAWACIRLLAENIGTLPLQLFRRDGKGEASLATGHLLYAVLHDQPNPDFTASEFWEGVVFHLATRGNSYAEIARRPDGSVISLTALDPNRVGVKRLRNGEREYRYADSTGARVIPSDHMFHVRGFGPGEDLGLSPIAFGARSMGLAMAAETSAARTFAQGGRPAGFFSWGTGEQAPNYTQWQQLKDLYFSPEAMKDRAADVMPLPPGATFSSTGLSPDDAQLLETRAFDVENVCRWFGVQPAMIGHTTKSTSFGAGLEQQNLWFLNKTLRPYLRRIKDAIASQLLLPAERGAYFAEFNAEGMLQTDSKTRSEFLRTYVDGGIMTVNEARRKENLPPLPGGDVLRVQAQNIPLASQAAATGPGVGHNGGPPLNEDEEAAA